MKDTVSRKVFNVFNILFMVFLCVIMLYPYLNQLAVSLNDSLDTAVGGITIFPRKPTFGNFKTVLTDETIYRSAIISVLRSVLGTFLALFVTYTAAYALSKPTLKGRTVINWYLSIPMYISAGTIPIYILYRYLGLMNNYLVYILPGMFSFYNMLIIRSYIESLPVSLEEAALVDGANEIQVMFKIFLPMSMPVIATVVLWVAVGYWNDWTTTLYYITKPKMYSLQYVMMQIIKQSEAAQNISSGASGVISSADKSEVNVTPESVQAAVIIVATVPIIIVYPFLQKYFIGGVTLGAVKG